MALRVRGPTQWVTYLDRSVGAVHDADQEWNLSDGWNTLVSLLQHQPTVRLTCMHGWGKGWSRNILNKKIMFKN